MIIRILRYCALIVPFGLVIFFTGCEKHPVNRLVNPTESNATGLWSGKWLIYGDEIKTGGGVMMFNTLEGVEIDFDSNENSKGGLKCLKFSWNGGDVTAYETPPRVEHDYVGFSLISAKSYENVNTETRDLIGGYSKISFWARGSLNANVYLRLEANNANYMTPSGDNAWVSNNTDRRIDSDWRPYEFTISGSMLGVKEFVRILLLYDEDGNSATTNTSRGTGGVVFIDDIKYE